jgi:hypothetical protein
MLARRPPSSQAFVAPSVAASNSMVDAVARAAVVARQAMSARRGRALNAAVGEFVHVLETVPDHAVSEFSDEAFTALQTLAERVIERIEARLDDGADRQSVQQGLARAVYDIRRALEEADRCRRHYPAPDIAARRNP